MNSSSTIERRLRINSGPIVLTGGRYAKRRVYADEHNTLLDIARDSYSGDMIDWALELLECVTWMRMYWDSPRLGGGIDPDIRLVGDGPAEGSGAEYTYTGIAEYIRDNSIEADTVQNWIAHAEAVARLTLAVYGEEG